MGRRILVLSDLWVPFPGGAERLMFNLARDLQHRGHDVRVVTGYEAAQQFDGPPVTGQELPLDEEGAAMIASAIRYWSPQVILTHHLYARTFAGVIWGAGVPVVEVILNGPRRACTFAVMISEHVAREVDRLAAENLGTPRHPDDLVLTPPAFDDVVADTHGDAIGFVKPYPHKGAELVYEIAAAMPERRFVVLRGEWQTLEIPPPPYPNIEPMEPVVDMRDFYRAVRLVLMPSLSEDAGTVAQEATANGLPCISSDVDGLAETNAGGIQLPPGLAARPYWCDAIRYLDDSDHYRDVVRSQREAQPDRAAVMALLSERIEAL